jgi:6-phosphogluconolactonase
MPRKKPIARTWFTSFAICLVLALGGCGGGSMTTNSVPPPITQNPGFAFVANTQSNTISAFQLEATSGKLLPLSSGPFPTGNGPEFLAVTPAGKFLFVGNSGSDTISAFQIDAASGLLTAVPGSPFVTGARPEGVAVDPMGRFLFVGNQAASSISAFMIAAGGALAPVPGSPFAAKSPFQIVTNPAGTILYANNFPDSSVSDFNSVSAFQISSAGALALVPGSPFPVANSSGFASAVGLAVDPGGKFMFVADHMAQAVVPFNIDQTNGALTPASTLPTPPLSCGVSCHNNPLRLAVNPNGMFVYAANVQAGTVSVYAVLNPGGLSPVMEFPVGQHPFGVAFDPKGHFLYVANKVDNTISAFSIDPANGFPAPVPGSPFPSGGSGPVGIVIVPAP